MGYPFTILHITSANRRYTSLLLDIDLDVQGVRLRPNVFCAPCLTRLSLLTSFLASTARACPAGAILSLIIRNMSGIVNRKNEKIVFYLQIFGKIT